MSTPTSPYMASSLLTPPSEALWIIPILVTIYEVIPWIVTKLVSLSVAVDMAEQKLLDEIQRLKQEQKDISMMDEFAKYAKIDRKIIKVNEQLKKYGNSRKEEASRAKRAFNLTFYGILALIYLFVLVTYGRQPLLTLKPESVYPLGYFISLPTFIPGAIGLPFWTMATKNVLAILKKLLEARRMKRHYDITSKPFEPIPQD